MLKKFASILGRAALILYGIATVGCFVLVVYVVVSVWISPSLDVPDRSAEEEKDPGDRFTAFTGLAWPKTASVVSVRYIDMFVDYEYGILFDIDGATARDWLAKPPPWGQGNWQHGPLPDSYRERGKCVSQLTGSIDAAASGASTSSATSTQPGDLWYSVDTENEQSGQNFGPLLIIDSGRNRVCLEAWTS